MGQVMRAMQGKANAQLVQQFLNEELSKHHE
jgi:Asp-tRNA(Asn)/Glu-tRNA(Gln) amidotransferase B subunit